ncbi:formin-like protein 16 [Iris pallida]|uniref:Formin-like protein 16 n=1 Tax=Iris pallida TaxID=29817 RepID=A0AAX6HVS9_IRIPA|nr:formin-like protein 16 [Iris pallida]
MIVPVIIISIVQPPISIFRTHHHQRRPVPAAPLSLHHHHNTTIRATQISYPGVCVHHRNRRVRTRASVSNLIPPYYNIQSRLCPTNPDTIQSPESGRSSSHSRTTNKPADHHGRTAPRPSRHSTTSIAEITTTHRKRGRE